MSHFQWARTLTFFVLYGLVWFVIFFVLNLVIAARAQPAIDILSEEVPPSETAKQPLSGFVAMEYYWLILNRTYLVFIASEGLYGWRAQGPVTASDPTYFEPYRQMLDDKELMRDRTAIEKLSRLAGGFFYRHSEIASVVADGRHKWGMAGIPHSGRVHVRLVSGKSREFILLGTLNPEEIRDKIVSVLGVQATSLA